MMECVSDPEIIPNVLNFFREDLPSLREGFVDIQEYSEKIRKYGNVCVFLSNAQWLGFAAYYDNDLVSRTAYLSLIAVKASARNAHIGTQILAYVERQSKESGMTRLKLEVSKDNVNAIRFYKKCGYTCCDEKLTSYYFSKIL